MQNNNKDISIIILTKNEEKNINRCLSVCFSQKCDYSFEAIVIDSGSVDNTVEIAKKYPVKLILIKSEEFHHAGTRNLGAKIAKGDYLVYLAGDAYPASRNWLSRLISNFEDNDIAAIYGLQIPNRKTNPINQFRIKWNYGSERIVKYKALLPVQGPRLYYFSTANCAIRKSVWEQFKFPENVPVYEDTAFIRNVINAGYKVVYEPEAKVYHAHNYSIWEIFRRYFDTGSIYKRLGYFSKANGKLNKEGIRYLKSGINFLIEKGYCLWIPYFIIHTAAGFIGLSLGKYSNKLPVFMKKKFSQYGV